MEKQDKGDPYENEAAVFFDDNTLVIDYGDDRNITMELSSVEERELVQTILSDINFWSTFLNALAISLEQNK